MYVVPFLSSSSSSFQTNPSIVDRDYGDWLSCICKSKRSVSNSSQRSSKSLRAKDLVHSSDNKKNTFGKIAEQKPRKKAHAAAVIEGRVIG